MTDNQFASYQKRLLRELEGIRNDLLKKTNNKSDLERLDLLIKDLEDELSRP